MKLAGLQASRERQDERGEKLRKTEGRGMKERAREQKSDRWVLELNDRLRTDHTEHHGSTQGGG